MQSSVEAQFTTPSLLRDSQTCWKAATATRATLLIDGEEYFAVLRQALLQAHEQILIAGWDLDSRILLRPREDRSPDELGKASVQLGELLAYLMRTRPGLQIHVVRWDYHWLYREDREADTRERLEQLGVHFHHHSDHPVTGCVHHKLVVIDDVLAFCGGIDLTHQRWDTCRHEPKNPHRRDHKGMQYMPVHDTQLCVSGPVAALLSAYVRDNWPSGAIPPGAPTPREEFWPSSLSVDFENIRAGVCRTLPASPRNACVREIEAFYLAAIGATQRRFYIENQYFTSTRIAHAIAEQCRRAPQLEGLMVGMDRPKTPVELHTMGYGLTRFRQVLAAACIDQRVPIVAALTGDQSINLHSKLAIFDDRWLTAGSANLNRRSMGFDIECNLVLEATTPHHMQRMEHLRHRLLAEHMGMDIDELAEAVREHGMAKLPDLAQRARRLIHLQPLQPEPVFGPVLAPLFDRDDMWVPPPSQLPAASHRLFGPLVLLAVASLALVGRDLTWHDLPSLTSLQQQLAQIIGS